jgi:hypothetical protein
VCHQGIDHKQRRLIVSDELGEKVDVVGIVIPSSSPSSDWIFTNANRSRSAPTASRRGRTVTAGESSAVAISVNPGFCAASHAVHWLLPSPPTPASTVTMRRGIRPGESHSTLSRRVSVPLTATARRVGSG